MVDSLVPKDPSDLGLGHAEALQPDGGPHATLGRVGLAVYVGRHGPGHDGQFAGVLADHLSRHKHVRREACHALLDVEQDGSVPAVAVDAEKLVLGQLLNGQRRDQTVYGDILGQGLERLRRQVSLVAERVRVRIQLDVGEPNLLQVGLDGIDRKRGFIGFFRHVATPKMVSSESG